MPPSMTDQRARGLIPDANMIWCQASSPTGPPKHVRLRPRRTHRRQASCPTTPMTGIGASGTVPDKHMAHTRSVRPHPRHTHGRQASCPTDTPRRVRLRPRQTQDCQTTSPTDNTHDRIRASGSIPDRHMAHTRRVRLHPRQTQGRQVPSPTPHMAGAGCRGRQAPSPTT